MNHAEVDDEAIEIIDVDRAEADAVIAWQHGEETDAGYDIFRKKFKIWQSRLYLRGSSGTDQD